MALPLICGYGVEKWLQHSHKAQEKPLCVPFAVFLHTIWIHCRGMKRNITELGICHFILILTLIEHL